MDDAGMRERLTTRGRSDAEGWSWRAATKNLREEHYYSAIRRHAALKRERDNGGAGIPAQNIDKWGKILSAADTFDDAAASDGSVKAQPTKMIFGLAPEWLLVGGSTPILLALLAKALGGL